MPAKGLGLLCFIALAAFASTPASAAEQPRSLLGEPDLKTIVLSPAPLGPPAQFEPPAATAKAEGAPAIARTETPAPARVTNIKPRQKAAVAARKPRAAPLDSYARDAQRQTWPCTGGGICAWTRPR